MKTLLRLLPLLAATMVGPPVHAGQVRVPIDSTLSSLNLQLCANPGGLGTQCDDQTRPAGGFLTVALDDNGNPTQIAMRNFEVRAVGDYNLTLSWLFGAARVDGTASDLRIYHARPGATNNGAPVAGGAFTLAEVPFLSSGTASYRINDLACGLVTFPCSSNIDLATLGRNSISLLPGTLRIENGVLTVHLDFNFETPLDPTNPALGLFHGHAILNGSTPIRQSLVPPGSDWRYVDTGADPGPNWATPFFDDTLWPFGPAQLGYGDGDEAAVVSFGADSNNKYITTYFRHTFQLTDAFDVTNLALRVLHDDGVVVYLNGGEIYRSNMPDGPPSPGSLAVTAVNGQAENVYFIAPPFDPFPLVTGRNVLAVEVHQASPASSDISFDLELLANTVLTDQPPTVVITNPLAGSSHPEGTVIIRANATDGDGLVTRVAFYQGDNLLGEDITAPYSVSWANACAGTYLLTARAYDTAGNETVSAPITVQVTRPPVPLVNAGAVWRYLDNGANQGTAWRTRIFNDAAWASGAAQLGFGDGDEITMINGGPAANRFVTTYFRHSFSVANAAGVAGFNLRLLRDDGAIIYLNGVEIYRNNLPTGAVDFLTLATTNAAGADETTNFITATVSATTLINGVNVLAVEVHQGATNSSDLSFDLAVTANVTNLPPTAVTLTAPAANTVLPPGASVQLQATATDAEGGVTRVQYFNGTNRIGEAAGPPYAFNWVNVPSGFYVLTARAFDNCGATRDSAPVELRVGAFSMIAPGSTWSYRDDGSDQGVAWRMPAFNDVTWSAGAAELGYGDGDETTIINGGPSTSHFITTYFRRAWDVPDPTVITGLVVRLLRDDGAAVYLNGVELLRSNLPEGPLNHLTPAMTAVAGTDESAYFITTADAGSLAAGRNVVAVEVHQQSGTSTDVSFDLDLVGLIRPFSPRLYIDPAGADHIVRWPSAAAGLKPQSTTNLAPPITWQEITTPPIDDGAWKTLQRPNAGGELFYRLAP